MWGREASAGIREGKARGPGAAVRGPEGKLRHGRGAEGGFPSTMALPPPAPAPSHLTGKRLLPHLRPLTRLRLSCFVAGGVFFRLFFFL